MLECDNLFVLDHTYYWSKVRFLILSNDFPNFTILLHRDSWPKTPYVKSIGYWIFFCYLSVFFCLLEYCLVLTLKNPIVCNQIGNTMVPEEEEQKRIRIALTIEKYSRICVPVYLFLFSSLYFIVMLSL